MQHDAAAATPTRRHVKRTAGRRVEFERRVCDPMRSAVPGILNE